MRWPRGRWNGQRITGLEVKIRIDVLWWRLSWFGPYGSCASFGPVHVWVSPTYHIEPVRPIVERGTFT